MTNTNSLEQLQKEIIYIDKTFPLEKNLLIKIYYKLYGFFYPGTDTKNPRSLQSGAYNKWKNEISPRLNKIKGLEQLSVNITLAFKETDTVYGQDPKGNFYNFPKLRKEFSYINSAYLLIQSECNVIKDNQELNIIEEKNNLIDILQRYSYFHEQLQANLRHKNRSTNTLLIMDEYDIQDIITAIIKLIYKNVDRENPNDKVAGSSTRLDIIIHDINTIV